MELHSVELWLIKNYKTKELKTEGWENALLRLRIMYYTYRRTVAWCNVIAFGIWTENMAVRLFLIWAVWTVWWTETHTRARARAHTHTHTQTHKYVYCQCHVWS